MLIIFPPFPPLTIRNSFKLCQLLRKGGQLGLVGQDLLHQGVQEGERPVPAPQQRQLQENNTLLPPLTKKIKHEKRSSRDADRSQVYLAKIENNRIKFLLFALLFHTSLAHFWCPAQLRQFFMPRDLDIRAGSILMLCLIRDTEYSEYSAPKGSAAA